MSVMTSQSGYGRGTFPNQPHLSAREAISRAHTMHTEVQELEDTIMAQQDEIAWLKSKMLHHRRHSLEKFFMWDDNFQVQACFHEWQSFWHKQTRLRDIDGLHSARDSDAGRAMEHLNALQAQLMEMDKAYQELAAKDAATKDKLARAEQLVRTVAGATTEYETETPAKTPKTIEGEATYIKAKINEIIGGSITSGQITTVAAAAPAVSGGYMQPGGGPSIAKVQMMSGMQPRTVIGVPGMR